MSKEFLQEQQYIVDEWVNKMGLRTEGAFRLSGGINNKVYAIGRNKEFVIKLFADAKGNEQDRMKAEVEFLLYASEVAPDYTPIVKDFNKELRCIVMERIRGESFAPNESLPQSAVNDAYHFFQLLNANTESAIEKITMNAAEGFQSISEHLHNIEERIDRLACDEINGSIRRNAQAALDRVRSEFEIVKKKTGRNLTKGLVRDGIDKSERCISPGDFGFHNALRTKDGTKFIDFEFAGWDDPAKTIVDFYLQPKISTRISTRSLAVCIPKSRRREVQERCVALLPVLEVKWKCIILSVLDKVRQSRLIEAKPDLDIDELIRERLKLAYEYSESMRDSSDVFANHFLER